MIEKRDATINKVTCGLENNELTTTFYFEGIERKSKSFGMESYEETKNVEQTLQLLGKTYLEELVGVEVTLVFDNKENLVALSKRNGDLYVLIPDEFLSCGIYTEDGVVRWIEK